MLRLATAADFDAVYRIYIDDSVNPFMFYEKSDKQTFRPVFDQLMAASYFWVFEDNGHVIGICKANIGVARASHVASLGTFGFRKEAQGKGFGAKMLREIISFLIGKGITRIELGVESDNPRAYAFYQKLGFIEEGRQKNYIKRVYEDHFIDEVMMALIV